MAQKTVVTIIDDLDGSELSEGEGATVRFALDGVQYDIDLSTGNAEKLRKTLEPYVDAGRRTGGRRTSGGHTRRVSTEVDTRAVREWANSRGIKVSTRGRVPADVIAQYREAGN